MMPQSNSGQPIGEEPRASYGRYEGSPSYAPPPPYEASYGPAPQFTEDHFDAIAQRMAQRMSQGSQGKIQPGMRGAPWGYRLALAIVSVGVLVPLSAILLAGVGGWTGLIAFGAACLAIMLINAVFNGSGH